MKYVMYQINGVPAPVLLPDHVPHKSIVIPLADFYGVTERKLLSAGFVQIASENGKLQVRADGQSESLGVASRPEDSQIIAAFLSL